MDYIDNNICMNCQCRPIWSLLYSPF